MPNNKLNRLQSPRACATLRGRDQAGVDGGGSADCSLSRLLRQTWLSFALRRCRSASPYCAANLRFAQSRFQSTGFGMAAIATPFFLPFVQRTVWWQSGLAGAIPSMASYVLACAGIYRLARRWMRPLLALLVFAALALNPGLLYMSVTAMTEPLYLALMIWSVVHLTAFEAAVREADAPAARRALVKLTLVLIAAVFTRYDGWILGTLAWLMAAYWTMRRGWWKEPANARVFVVCTLCLAGRAAELAWI